MDNEKETQQVKAREDYDRAFSNPNNWKPNFKAIAQDSGRSATAASMYFERKRFRYKLEVEIIKQ